VNAATNLPSGLAEDLNSFLFCVVRLILQERSKRGVSNASC
jgi:hypothetical protein